MKRPPESPPPLRATDRKPGPLRPLVLTVGIFYLAMALSEILLGSEGLLFRDHQVLLFATVQNLLHWGVGVVLVLGFLGGRMPARVASLAMGLGLMLLAAGGVLARHRVGGWLGFESTLPFAYNAIHGLSGLALVVAGLGLLDPTRQQS